MQQLKFSSQTEFYHELKRRVNEYFVRSKKNQWGDYRIHLKAIIFISLFIGSYVTVVFLNPAAWISIIICVLAGILTAGIGFNMMHDGSHGTFSNNKVVNRMAALSLNFLGCSSHFWNLKHNIVHHTYTN